MVINVAGREQGEQWVPSQPVGCPPIFIHLGSFHLLASAGPAVATEQHEAAGGCCSCAPRL